MDKEFSEQALDITILPMVGEISCREPPQSSASAVLTGTCWEAGRLKAAKGIHEWRNTRLQLCRGLYRNYSPAEADDIDALGIFLESWEVPVQEVLRVKNLLASRTFTDVVRESTPEVPTIQLELAQEELVPDEDLDERLSMMKKASTEKQQVWNRVRSDLLGLDHKQTRIILRAELEPVYYTSCSGKRRIKVGQCYMLFGVHYMNYEYVGASLPGSASCSTVCKWCAKSRISSRIRTLLAPTLHLRVRKTKGDGRSSLNFSIRELVKLLVVPMTAHCQKPPHS